MNPLTKQSLQYIKKHGTNFVPAVLPKDLQRGDVGDCFDICAIQALHHQQYQYVEGIAKVRNGRWIYHAWLTDGVHAFDPTWRAITDEGWDKPIPAEYLGVILPIMQVAEFMKKTEYKAVFANRFRAPELVERMLA